MVVVVVVVVAIVVVIIVVVVVAAPEVLATEKQTFTILSCFVRILQTESTGSKDNTGLVCRKPRRAYSTSGWMGKKYDTIVRKDNMKTGVLEENKNKIKEWEQLNINDLQKFELTIIKEI